MGCVVVDATGELIATGWSGRRDQHDHAEESALADVAGDPRLAGAVLYSSLEPCSARASRPRSCTRLILDAGIPRIVYAWREPELFLRCEGDELLRAAGRTVLVIPDLAPLVRATNTHLPGID